MIYSPKEFNIRYQATLYAAGESSIRVWLSQPLNFATQKIESFSISPKPQKHYKDAQGNKVLYFEFKDSKKISIQMDITATLWKNNIDVFKEDLSFPSASTKLFRRYTKNEKFLEQIAAIKDLTRKVTSEDKCIVNAIQSVFNFIVRNFRYRYPITQRGMKYVDVKRPEGDCGEYSSLFVTMCRILKIPARNNTGFVIFPRQKKVIEHGWASLYLKRLGWLDFDTQYASLEKNTNKYFGKRSDYRIVFTNGFNIPLRPNIPKDFKTDYWNRCGLPLTKSSVQTLQPMIFASKEDVKFRDSIELLS